MPPTLGGRRRSGIDAGEDAIEAVAPCDRRLARGIGERLQARISQPATARRKPGSAAIARLGRATLVGGKRAEHVFAREGVEFVAVSVRHRGIPSTR